ncbi:MAG: hybrid sensor histidine kinase/response regulator [Chloroflexota bacterium]
MSNLVKKEYTILIVDDTPANLRLLMTYLQRPGFNILSARNGQSGLQRAQYGQPDLILLDVLMPGIDGFETCRQLKAHPQTANIPVIFMTALSDKEYIVQGFQAGAVDYITKPIQVDELWARVTTHLRIHDLTQHLEQEITARTGELEESLTREKLLAAELRTALEHQRELDTIKTQVINVVSHEFRTPLNIISGSFALLREHLNTLTQQHRNTIFNRIDQSILYLTELLDDAFFVNASHDQNIAVQSEPVILPTLVQKLVQELQLQHSNRKIISHFHNLEAPIQVDPRLLRHVIANLLSNALKFSSPPSPVYLAACLESHLVTISIQDEGLGIPKEDISHIFDLFYRGSNVETVRGLGLGLAITKRLVQAMEGEIFVDSSGIQTGSTFVVKIPI